MAGSPASEGGREQMRGYLPAFDATSHRLAESPLLGRACADLQPGYFRLEQGKHVVFFRRVEGEAILIVRVLHERMLPDRHLGDRDA